MAVEAFWHHFWTLTFFELSGAKIYFFRQQIFLVQLPKKLTKIRFYVGNRGTFLQKNQILRCYLQNQKEGRQWVRVWSKKIKKFRRIWKKEARYRRERVKYPNIPNFFFSGRGRFLQKWGGILCNHPLLNNRLRQIFDTFYIDLLNFS